MPLPPTPAFAVRFCIRLSVVNLRVKLVHSTGQDNSGSPALKETLKEIMNSGARASLVQTFSIFLMPKLLKKR